MMFLERLIQTGMKDNPIYYSLTYSWFAKDDLWLPNCTAFACSRSSELCGRNVKSEIPRGNAQTWYDASKWIGSKLPQVGAIAVWGGGKYGHVGIVERINKDGTVLISQSNYTRKSKADMIANYFVLGTYKPIVGYVTKGIGWKFIGYLLNPYVNDVRVSRDETKYQIEVIGERVRARKSPNGEIYSGQFIPLGIYNILEEQGDWVRVDDNVWFSKGSWAKVYDNKEALRKKLESLIAQRDDLNKQIEEIEKRL